MIIKRVVITLMVICLVMVSSEPLTDSYRFIYPSRVMAHSFDTESCEDITPPLTYYPSTKFGITLEPKSLDTIGGKKSYISNKTRKDGDTHKTDIILTILAFMTMLFGVLSIMIAWSSVRKKRR